MEFFTEYQKYAICYTDFWEAYALIFPKERHLAVEKKTGRTNQIEGFNCKMRQRVARLVRKTLSQKSWQTTSVRFGLSSIIIINHYMFSTSQNLLR